MVSFFTAAFVAIAVANTGVYATPVARTTCTPNAQGAGVSIESVVYSGLEWGDEHNPPTSGDVLTGQSFRGLTVPDFHVQQSGQYPGSFIITDVNNNNLAVTNQGSELSFSAASASGNQQNQLFDIACQSCSLTTSPGSHAGSVCTITPHGSSGQCVTIPANSFYPLSVDSCDDGLGQLFDIVF